MKNQIRSIFPINDPIFTHKYDLLFNFRLARPIIYLDYSFVWPRRRVRGRPPFESSNNRRFEYSAIEIRLAELRLMHVARQFDRFQEVSTTIGFGSMNRRISALPVSSILQRSFVRRIASTAQDSMTRKWHFSQHSSHLFHATQSRVLATSSDFADRMD